jgi:iron complex outermembrane recepter protein
MDHAPQGSRAPYLSPCELLSLPRFEPNLSIHPNYMNRKKSPKIRRMSVQPLISSCLIAALSPALFFATQSEVRAQQSATGTVTGRVYNVQDGKYLPRARVSVQGTQIETFTDDYGQFVLNNVPAGDVTINADFTGQATSSTTINVPAGQTVSRELQFNAGTGKVNADGAIVLDPFEVQAQRYQSSREIAINEERFSPSIKNVVSVDQFGDIPNGNVGEFVKFLPGVLVSYGALAGANQGYADSDATAVSIRGFGPEDTAILIDGMPVSSANPGGLTRTVVLDMLAVNNASRVELIKVATPDMPSNSIGGQINLITKSAFEFAKPEITYKVFATLNSLNTDLGKTVGPTNKSTYKTIPGFEFSAIYPLSSKLGISVTGFWADEFNQTYRSQSTYAFTGNLRNAAGELVSVTNPYLNRYQVTDTPRITERRSANVKLDWKPTPSQFFTTNFQYSTYDSIEAQRRLDLQVASPTDWGPTFTRGALNNTSSRNNMTVTTRDKVGNTKSGQFQYKLQKSGWDIQAGASISVSRGSYEDMGNGHFSEVALQLQPGSVAFLNVKDGRTSDVLNYARTTNERLDYSNLANWRFDGTQAKSGETESKNTIGLYKLDIRRELDFIPWLGSNTMAVKVGARRDEEKQEKWGVGTGYREILRPGASYNVVDILDTHYVGQSPGFGLPGQQWASTYKLWEIEQEKDIFYAPDDGGDAVQNWNSYVNQQKSITETTDAAYAMLEGRFFKNRLTFVGGARQERKTREGYGPFTDSKWNFLKLPNGRLYTDAANPTGVRIDQAASPVFAQTAAGTALRQALTSAGVTFPTTPYSADTSTSLASRKLQLIPNRYVNQRLTGDPSFSLSAAFDLTKKIVLKAAYSRSFGLPKLEETNQGILSGNNTFTINENSPVPADGTRGTIGVANPGLMPKVSDNWDFQIAYYTESGGKLTASYYYKVVSNDIITNSTFSGSPAFNEILPAIGLDPEDYVDWRLTTSTNSSAEQKTDGYEFEVSQDFRFLGGWGKHFQAFASFTYKTLGDPPVPVPYTITAPNGQVITVNPTQGTISMTANKFAGAGIQFNTRRFTVQLRGTYRNRNERGGDRVTLPNGNFLRRFEPEETRIDISANYRLSEKYSLFVSARDAFNGSRKQVNQDDLGLWPAYAEPFDYKEFGTSVYFGVNGRF